MANWRQARWGGWTLTLQLQKHSLEIRTAGPEIIATDGKGVDVEKVLQSFSSHRSGLNVYEAIGTCIEHSGQEPSPMPWADALTHSEVELDKLRETSRRMSALAG